MAMPNLPPITLKLPSLAQRIAKYMETDSNSSQTASNLVVAPSGSISTDVTRVEYVRTGRPTICLPKRAGGSTPSKLASQIAQARSSGVPVYDDDVWEAGFFVMKSNGCIVRAFIEEDLDNLQDLDKTPSFDIDHYSCHGNFKLSACRAWTPTAEKMYAVKTATQDPHGPLKYERHVYEALSSLHQGPTVRYVGRERLFGLSMKFQPRKQSRTITKKLALPQNIYQLEGLLGHHNGPLHPYVARFYMTDILRKLHRIHQAGYYHGNIDISSFMMSEDGFLLFSDFFLAKKDCEVIWKDPLHGNNQTAAPEWSEPQSGHRRARRPGDLWSVAIVAHVMTFGEYPYGISPQNKQLVFTNRLQTIHPGDPNIEARKETM
ncbi:hypothetical protein M422DRAFT_56559 [Sphaerobolus stellatus SS14]|uniref:Protein kinase domain-containing protein n=1 Tax=Sphaerobolus stellatus (strain SS14) TaxID=990650 RepID=A0A0C9TQ46_SPHS4|nr:hypothetical protein M422DRAFT_56559 [Sphaerobolus stellatus SS14]